MLSGPRHDGVLGRDVDLEVSLEGQHDGADVVDNSLHSPLSQSVGLGFAWVSELGYGHNSTVGNVFVQDMCWSVRLVVFNQGNRKRSILCRFIGVRGDTMSPGEADGFFKKGVIADSRSDLYAKWTSPASRMNRAIR